jgi:stage III sporulation protein SpoIIIAA
VAQIYEKLGYREPAMDWTIKAVEHGYPIDNIRKSPTMRDLVKNQDFINRLKQLKL